ncbi:hypothetical protein Fmac_032590 [Flemingia macrophylla]|uniref:G-patch domain-containing protein n=1 Tax=Flemingia macrophylla TaxID=520843 RepID=A0ABD1L5B9_9FABA
MRQIYTEKDQPIDRVNELQALISFYKQKAKEDQTNCDNMSRAVHEQVKAMARHVGQTEDELRRHIDPPLEDDMLINKPSALPYVDAVEEAIETSFQALEIANVEKFLRDMKMVTQMLTRTGYQPGQGLGKNSQGIIEPPIIRDNPRK